ncbi:MAG TPA: valine--tRNA ligase [bacterium]|nr:valine--tRNA ligase [bacterium]HPO51552.1 valine--tRNA ligase [bacterium]
MKDETRYNAEKIEHYWYSKWEESGCFNVTQQTGTPYVIVIPPPNVTGYLHIGHALNNTIQDILIRWKRMAGFNALWVPGTDHAGIATQNVVEKELMKKGLTREALGREKFLEEVWKWRDAYGNRIIEQLKRLGASCDWHRTCFTMDKNFSQAVQTVFIKLYEKGLIYRGTRIINWCPRCTTALSDEEVEYREENGFLYYLKYPVEENGYLVVATTRPETMLGDTAVAVNPSDERYKDFIGTKVHLPFVNRLIPVIADTQVDMEFGTGAVKVTPSHDPADYSIAKRHNLEFLTVMDETAKMNENAGIFKGLDRFECRRKIIEHLQEQKLIEKIEPYSHRIGHCYRCDTLIEPYISRQWFVDMKKLAEPAIKVVLDGGLKFYPERWTKIYLQWLYNIQDWCISRQIWWGHRIPVWYCSNSDCPPVVSISTPRECPCCNGRNFVQDDDVLDTWFSSWLWPFAVFGWPEKTKDLEYFYPTNTLVTAQEILFFWVARMVMAGFEFMEEKPFESVYIHGTVRDETGRKMSKSLGNAVDPIEIIDEVGADALRFSLISLTSFGQDVFLPEKFHYKGRNFINKIWNSFRYLEMLVEKNNCEMISTEISGQKFLKDLGLAEKWILTLLNTTTGHVNKCLEEFKFNEAADSLYEFFWHQYCDWYVELSKMYSEKDTYLVCRIIPVMVFVMMRTLKLLHPFVPFITEELWNRLKKITYIDDAFITKSTWPIPDAGFEFPEAVAEMEEIKKLVIEIRDIKTTFKIPVTKNMEAIYRGISLLNFDEARQKVEFLSKTVFLYDNEAVGYSEDMLVRVWNDGWFAIKVKGLLDINAEKQKLLKEKDKVEKILTSTEKKLSNPDFLKHAPADVVEKTKKLCDDLAAELTKIEKNFQLLTREKK